MGTGQAPENGRRTRLTWSDAGGLLALASIAVAGAAIAKHSTLLAALGVLLMLAGRWAEARRKNALARQLVAISEEGLRIMRAIAAGEVRDPVEAARMVRETSERVEAFKAANGLTGGR